MQAGPDCWDPVGGGPKPRSIRLGSVPRVARGAEPLCIRLGSGLWGGRGAQPLSTPLVSGLRRGAKVLSRSTLVRGPVWAGIGQRSSAAKHSVGVLSGQVGVLGSSAAWY